MPSPPALLTAATNSALVSQDMAPWMIGYCMLSISAILLRCFIILIIDCYKLLMQRYGLSLGCFKFVYTQNMSKSEQLASPSSC